MQRHLFVSFPAEFPCRRDGGGVERNFPLTLAGKYLYMGGGGKFTCKGVGGKFPSDPCSEMFNTGGG